MRRNRAPAKTATLPSLRVDPHLREAAEAVLEDNESLSTFIEDSVRARIARRQAQRTFIERGLASRDHARNSGRYVPAQDVLQALGQRLERKRRKCASMSASRKTPTPITMACTTSPSTGLRPPSPRPPAPT